MFEKPKNPNIILILVDDMGYSDIGCYGGEIDTPSLNYLAENGLRFTRFYNTARCCPSRASLLTGLHPHQAGVGHMVSNLGPEEYSGSLNHRCVTIAEVLKENGYSTYLSGKWHVTNDKWHINDSWPNQRGFDKCYCFLGGASSYFWPKTMVRDNKDIDEEIKNDENYYITDAISENAVKYIKEHYADASTNKNPFFLYVAYNAPHWPLHAKEKDISKYKGRFDKGWDELRLERLKRMQKMSLIDEKWELTDRDPKMIAWDIAENKKWDTKRMEVYAAQIDAFDQGIGTIIETLKQNNTLDDTLILFLSDNGGCAECIRPSWGRGKIRGGSAQKYTRDGKLVKFGNTPEIDPGSEDSYVSYGVGWANLSNTPFRLYKQWTHEGGIATPFIAFWPNGIREGGELRHQPAQLTDIMATILEITGSIYPKNYKGREILPPEGKSMVPLFENLSNGKEILFFEHQGNASVIEGNWKLVRDYPLKWELYNTEEDRTEMYNIIHKNPKQAQKMISVYENWAKRIKVRPFNQLMARKYAKWIPSLIRNKIAELGIKARNSHEKWHKLVTKRGKEC